MSIQKTIIHGKVVTPFQIINEGMVIVEGERIIYVGEQQDAGWTEHDRIITIHSSEYIIPGFIDIHCHGGGGVWSYDDPQTFADFHLMHGTTSILPTLDYNQTHLEIMAGLKRVLTVMSQKHSSIAGIHMEGPYINPKYGAITSPIRQVDPGEYREILALAGEQIKVWTLAPELEGQQLFMEEAAKYGIIFSVGHSEASPETIFAAVRYGMRIGCHLTNASGVTPSPSRYDGTREVGVHEAVMLHDDMYAEVIPDAEGIHVRPLMLRLIVKTKGVNQVLIITDAIDQMVQAGEGSHAGAATGCDVNLIRGNSWTPSDRDEILSGSLLTMNRAVNNMRKHTGVGLVDACKMASLNQARLLGMDRDLGSIEQGKRANLLVVTDAMQVNMVMLEGHIVHPYVAGLNVC